MNKVMDLSEAKAMRKVFHETIAAAHGNLSAAMKPELRRSPQRRGPAFRRMVILLRKHLKPIMSYDDMMKGGGRAFFCAGTLEGNHITPSVITLTKKMKLDFTRTNFRLTNHALDRLIQYYQIREFDELHPRLKDVVDMMLHSAVSNEESSEKTFILHNNMIEGHFVLKHDEGTNDLYAVTWVGARSYSPALINRLRVEYSKECNV